jgi:hypothetical protein
MATTYDPYKGTYDTEYAQAMKQAQTERSALDSSLSGIRQTDEAGLASQRDYAQKQLGQSLGQAQTDAYGAYQNQQRLLPNQLRALGITGGGSETANARLNTAYQNTRGTAQQSYDRSLADVLQQWNMGMNDIASRYGQMGYQNLQNMYANANSNAWNRYNTGLSRDSDLYGRWWAEQEAARAQANADREYQLALQQWQANQAQANAARSGGGGGYVPTGPPPPTIPSTERYMAFETPPIKTPAKKADSFDPFRAFNT